MHSGHFMLKYDPMLFSMMTMVIRLDVLSGLSDAGESFGSVLEIKLP